MPRRVEVVMVVIVVVGFANIHTTNSSTSCNHTHIILDSLQEVVTSHHPVVISSSPDVNASSVSTKVQGRKSIQLSQNTRTAYVTSDSSSISSNTNAKENKERRNTKLKDLNSNSNENESAGNATRSEDMEECIAYLSVQNSTVGRVEGDYEDGRIYNSYIGQLGGDYLYLVAKESEINSTSVSGKVVEIEDSKIELIMRLKVEKCLQLRRTELGTLAHHSMFLLPDKEGLEKVHEIHSVNIQKLEKNALVVMGTKVNLRNMTISHMDKDAIVVRNKGILMLNDVTLHCNEYDCINVETGGKVILRNITLGNKTITKMDLLTTSTANMYPLFALLSMDHNKSLSMTFPLYWVVIMTGCGLVAGIVIGSAVVWKKPRRNIGTTSTFTLADLLFHDKLQDAHETVRSNHRPDSGLTSSSFGSFTAFQDSKLHVESGFSGYSNDMNPGSTCHVAVKDV